MLAMTDFCKNGGLGNQLFQYAFMRTQAEILKTKLFLPEWVGDQAFDLKDDHLRINYLNHGLQKFKQPWENCGFAPIKLNDETDVSGYFQSENFFDKELIRSIYVFSDEIKNNGLQKLKYMNPELDVCLSIRLGDFRELPHYYVPTLAFHKKALEVIKPRNLYLFSDEISHAKKIVSRIGFEGEIIPVDGRPIDALYSMTCFKKFIIGPSTFSWWGAWLALQRTIVIAPLEGALRPGSPVQAEDYWPNEWIRIKAIPSWRSYKLQKVLRKFEKQFLKLRGTWK
jgi:hypothetical protein